MAYTTEVIEIKKITSSFYKDEKGVDKKIFIIQSLSNKIFQYVSLGLVTDILDLETQFLELSSVGDTLKIVYVSKSSTQSKIAKINKIIKIILEEEKEVDILENFLKD